MFIAAVIWCHLLLTATTFDAPQTTINWVIRNIKDYHHGWKKTWFPWNGIKTSLLNSKISFQDGRISLQDGIIPPYFLFLTFLTLLLNPQPWQNSKLLSVIMFFSHLFCFHLMHLVCFYFPFFLCFVSLCFILLSIIFVLIFGVGLPSI